MTLEPTLSELAERMHKAETSHRIGTQYVSWGSLKEFALAVDARLQAASEDGARFAREAREREQA